MGDDHDVETQKMCEELEGTFISKVSGDGTFDTIKLKPNEMEMETEMEDTDTDSEMSMEMEMEMKMAMALALQEFDEEQKEEEPFKPSESQKLLDLCHQSTPVGVGEPCIVHVPMDCKLHKLLIKEGSKVTKGDPMYLVCLKLSIDPEHPYGPPQDDFMDKDSSSSSSSSSYSDLVPIYEHMYSRSPWDPVLITAPSSLMVVKILVEEGTELKKDQHFFTVNWCVELDYDIKEEDLDLDVDEDEYAQAVRFYS